MTKEAALHGFFNSFGIPGYPSSAVPGDVVFPYLTYDDVIEAYFRQASITVNLWYYTTSEAEPNAKAQELSDGIGLGGKLIPCDGGYLWVKRGSPWCQSLADDASPDIKRRYINVEVEYLTN